MAERRGPELRAPALAAVALALLALTGLASSASAWPSARDATSAPTTALRALAVAGGALLVVALLLVWIRVPKAPRPRRRRRDELDELAGSLWSASTAVAVVVLAVAVFCLAALPLLARPSAPSESTPTTQAPTVAGPPRTEGRTAAPSLSLGWLVVPVAVAFAILAPAAVLIRRRTREPRDGDERGALADAVRASIAALESERDPRRAILRAYARMEHGFRRVELTRARDETASEFLQRTTRQLPVSAAAAAELTGRFEEARFSAHRLTEADREQALASLHRVERALAERP